MGGDAANIDGITRQHRHRPSGRLDHRAEVGVGHGEVQRVSEGSGTVSDLTAEHLLVGAKPVDHGCLGAATVPGGLHANGCRDDEPDGPGFAKVSGGNDLEGSERAAVLAVMHVGERLDRLVVEHGGPNAAHAAAARPAA